MSKLSLLKNICPTMIRCKPYVFRLHACILCGDTGPILALLDWADDGESVLRQQVSNKKVWTSEADSSPFSDVDIFFFSPVSYIYFACIFQIHKCIGGSCCFDCPPSNSTSVFESQILSNNFWCFITTLCAICILIWLIFCWCYKVFCVCVMHAKMIWFF